MMGVRYTFQKSERLRSRRIIEDVFKKRGKSMRSGPLLFVYLPYEIEGPFPAQVLISVSKRKFNKAHDRNRIKRKIKEAYRLSKHRIYEHLQRGEQEYALALLYMSDGDSDLSSIQEHLNQLIDGFIKRTS